MLDLQMFDYIILSIFGLSIYVGWKNGFIKSLIAFFAWFGSIIIVADNYETAFNFVQTFVNSKFISSFIASIGFYVVLVIIFSLLGESISKKTSKFSGSTTDKVTGGAFGAFCGLLAVCTIFWCCYMTLMTLNDQKFPKWFAESKTYKPLKLSSEFMVDFITSPEQRHKLLNLLKKKSNSLEEEVKKNLNSQTKTVNEKINNYRENQE